MTAGDLWVFGYGSLMWRPGFAYEERQIAEVVGYHRALCIYSHVHRGTLEQPGLVLGLDYGGACAGVAFRVSGAHREETIAYLREREQITFVYREVMVRAKLADGRDVAALAYVADRAHSQYARYLSREDTLNIVRQGCGQSGSNPDYVRSTYEHLAALGLEDEALAWIVARL